MKKIFPIYGHQTNNHHAVKTMEVNPLIKTWKLLLSLRELQKSPRQSQMLQAAVVTTIYAFAFEIGESGGCIKSQYPLQLKRLPRTKPCLKQFKPPLEYASAPNGSRASDFLCFRGFTTSF
jgi:hypothetical protein